MAISDRDAEKIFKAFANRRRVAILRYLRTEKEAMVSDIAEKIHLSFKATSKHLSILSAVNILERQQRGLQVFYRFASDMPEPARKMLALF